MMKEFLTESAFFGVWISLVAYEAGRLIKSKFRFALLNPLLIGVIVVMVVLVVFKIDYVKYQESAKYISYLLTPSTICLAVPLYQQVETLKNNKKAIAGGITAGVLTSFCSVFVLAQLFSLTHEQYVTLLPKSITTAIGMSVSKELGGVETITVAVIILTGILGNVLAEFLCNICRIQEPAAKGLALGASAHAIGTAKAMELGETEGAMSSLAIAVAGLMTVFGAPLFANLM